MSRTDNTMPVTIQEADGKLAMADAGGAYAGIGRRTAKYWRAQRAAVRRQLRAGREPEPTRPRHGEKWDYW
jgi:hypothetical protein